MRSHRLGVVVGSGWLVVVSPFSGDATLPVSRWDVQGTYESDRECERARHGVRRRRIPSRIDAAGERRALDDPAAQVADT